MIEVISKNEEFVTLRMPTQYAYDNNLLSEMNVNYAQNLNIEEVYPEEDEIEILKKYSGTNSDGLMSWFDFKKKYAW